MLPTADLIAVHRHVAAAGAKLLLDRRPPAARRGRRRRRLGLLAAAARRADRRPPVHPTGNARRRCGCATATRRPAEYRRRGRLLDGGTANRPRPSAARAWLADTLAGRRSVLVVDTNEGPPGFRSSAPSSSGSAGSTRTA